MSYRLQHVATVIGMLLFFGWIAVEILQSLATGINNWFVVLFLIFVFVTPFLVLWRNREAFQRTDQRDATGNCEFDIDDTSFDVEFAMSGTETSANTDAEHQNNTEKPYTVGSKGFEDDSEL